MHNAQCSMHKAQPRNRDSKSSSSVEHWALGIRH
jgi:hypothetical protein